MKVWGTSIFAIHNITGELVEFAGENVEAPTKQLAIKWCKINAGYLHVNDEIVMEIPCKAGTYEPDLNKAIDYEKTQQN